MNNTLLKQVRIVETAFVLFCNEGIAHVSMTMIAHEARISESTLYRYFPTKQQLVLETISEYQNRSDTFFLEKIKKFENYDYLTGFQQIEVIVEIYSQVIQESADYMQFCYEAQLFLIRSHPEAGESVIAYAKTVYLMLDSAYKKGRADDSITVDIDVEDFYITMRDTLIGYITKIIIYDKLIDGINPWKAHLPILKHAIANSLSMAK